MEKGELLDIMDKIKGKLKTGDQRAKSRCLLISLFSLYILLFCVSSCSLPRIIVLDDPLTPEEHINLGVAYEQKGEPENATEEYRKAAKKLPVAYIYLGNACMQMNKPDEAEGHYRKAIEKEPDNPATADAYNNLAWLYYTKGENLEEAEALALKAVSLVPSRETYQDTLAEIRAEIKNK